MRRWNGMHEKQVQDAAAFEKFKNIYLADKENKPIHTSSLTSRPISAIERLKKELKQRFVYNLFDTEIYHHHWLKRFFKTVLWGVLADRSFVPSRGKRVFTFFLSSVYDPQLDIPTHNTIAKHLRAVLDGFQLFRRSHPEFWLLIKEHPLDESRSLFWNLYKQNNKNNVRWTIQSSKQLISISDGIITINSTVGIDALMRNKPVLCLGDSCYRHDGITVPCSELFSAESISAALEQLVIFRPDHRTVDLFLADAYKKTQAPVWQSSNEKEGIRQGLISYLEEFNKHQ
jgi:hypothetical protein